jgi:hypothetical protein
MIKHKYRVIYGETRPAWHKDCFTVKNVHKFVGRCMRVGDVVFGIYDMRQPRPALLPMSLSEHAANAEAKKETLRRKLK